MGLVAREQLGRGSTPRLILEIDNASFWPALSFTTKQAPILRRTRAAGNSGRALAGCTPGAALD